MATQSTKLTITASDTTPAVGQAVTFTVTLKAGTTPLLKPVHLWCTFNGVRYERGTVNAVNGVYTFTGPFSNKGQVIYHAEFAGDSSYAASSGTVTVNVGTPKPTIYYVPQAGSTWTNRGTAGASYNAYISNPNLFKMQTNGYPYWDNTMQNGFVCIPAGSATNNQNVASWEIGFHYTGLSDERHQRIWDKAAGGFYIGIDTVYGAQDRSYLVIYRVTTAGPVNNHARWYIPTDTVLRAGHNYYIQIAWDARAGPGHEAFPTIWIGEDAKAPVHQTHWDESAGALGGTGAWSDDSAGPANLASISDILPCGSPPSNHRNSWLNGGIFVYRQYNSIVDFSSGGSWNTDKLAWTT